jgi:hypothetical protein
LLKEPRKDNMGQDKKTKKPTLRDAIDYHNIDDLARLAGFMRKTGEIKVTNIDAPGAGDDYGTGKVVND